MKRETIQKIILTMILMSSVAMIGCSQPSNNTSTTTTTSLAAITPTGTIQGVLIDAVTQQPIAGAVIDIGLSSATTNQDGQFVLSNIPATQIGTGAAAGTTLTGIYEVSINLKGVTSPVKMADATIKNRYPDFSFKQAKVEYTSDVGHPLTGVAKGYQFTVGKLAASIAGIATDKFGTPVAAGLDVTLYSNLNAQNSTTGSNTGPNSVSGVVATTTLGGTVGANTATGTPVTGNILGTAKTAAGGTFAFNNIEAGVSVTIAVQDTAGTLFGQSAAITTPAEGATRTLSFEAGDAVIVASTDTKVPTVVSVTPENNSDITPAATSVVFTFSEPIKQTSVVADVSPSNPNGLYSLVDVNFTGPKPLASNLTHSLAWNTASVNDAAGTHLPFTQLTVTLPAVGASSLYTVDLTRAASTLKDDADNPVATPGSLAAAELAKLAVAFTTNGGATAAAPVIAMTNSASINATSLTTGFPVKATLDWLPVSGAKGYNVYRTKNEVWGTTIVTHQAELINPVVGAARPILKVSNLTDTFMVIDPVTGLDTATKLDYVENNDVKLTYSYVVKSVNSDGIESVASSAVPPTDVVTAADLVAPSLVAGGGVACLAGGATCDATGKMTKITIPFDEAMDKSTVAPFTLPAGLYTGSTGISFSSASYDTATKKVTLTLTTPIAALAIATTIPYGTISTGANGINNTVAAAVDTVLIAWNKGQANSTCILPAAAAGSTLVTAAPAALSDDVVTGTGTTAGNVSSGPDGICQTTAAVGDRQMIPVGQGQPNTTAIILSSGSNALVPLVDDQKIAAGTVVTVAGAKDVALNSLGASSGAGKTKYNADGTVN